MPYSSRKIQGKVNELKYAGRPFPQWLSALVPTLNENDVSPFRTQFVATRKGKGKKPVTSLSSDKRDEAK